MFDWKYGLVLVGSRNNKQICEIYELYQDENDEWTLFAAALVDSMEEVEKLYNDIKRDGMNTWFYENGKFLYNLEKEKWEWEREK